VLKSAFDLTQAVADGVGRRFELRGAVHQTTDVAVEGGGVLADQEETTVDTLLPRLTKAKILRGTSAILPGYRGVEV
jgi:hypothetical protein